MKKILILSLAAAFAFPAMADLGGAGYYRVENYKTERWVSVIDNRGSIDLGSTSADLQAIRLQRDFSVVSGDAASVLYIKSVGSEYQITTQGTGIYEIIDHYLRLRENGSANGQKLYMAYGTYNGATRYLGDGTVGDRDFGGMSTATTGDYRKWYILPISADSDNYFGANADLEVNGTFYTTMYASFPYSAYTEGVKFYYVSRTIGECAELKELEGTVPENTPVIIECAGETASENRLNVGGEASAITGNAMGGFFFNCSLGGHINRLAYNPKTMRLLGRCSDGKLGFVTADIDYIPANTSYLKVAEDAPSEIRIVGTEEYDEYYKYYTGVEGVTADTDRQTDIYTMTGILLHKGATHEQIEALPAGMYVIGGKKIVKR